MTRYADTIAARVDALLDGSYTAGGRYVSGATFVKAKPASSELAAYQDVPSDRVYDVDGWATNDYAAEHRNPYQGPHLVDVSCVLRVQYAVDRVDAMEPPAGGDLGATDTAKRKATQDAETLRWVLTWSPNWSGVAIGCTIGVIPPPVSPDPLRVVVQIPLTITVARPVTSPGWS